MISNIYKIADKLILIDSVYDRVQEYCKDYRLPQNDKDDQTAYGAAPTPDIVVRMTQEDIDYERERNARTCELEGRRNRNSSDDYLEELAVYRKIAEKMPDYDTILFHGSCIAVDNEAYLFAAVSGTGKSTHARLWREYLGEKAVMVNDDKPLIRIDDNGATVFGTPYNGKHRLGNNIAVPLKAVCILTRAENNTIVPVSKEEAYVSLVQQIYRPSNPVGLMKTMQLFDRLTDNVKLYRLGCNMEPEAARISFEGMK